MQPLSARPLRCLRFAGVVAVAALTAAAAAAADGGCGQCDFLITGRDGDSYTATAGNTVCVDESATFTGTITLKGGAFEVCGTAIPSSIRFEAGDSAVANHGTLRYFSLALGPVEVSNHGVLVTYGDLVVGPGASLVNHAGGFVGVGGQLRNLGSVKSAGIFDASGSFHNAGSLDNGGLINAHRTFENEGEVVNRGRINANELFHNAEGCSFESHGGTVAAFDLVNEGLLFGDPGAGCNSFLVANRWRLPAKGELVGALDFCAAGRNGGRPSGVDDSAVRITSCACFNP